MIAYLRLRAFVRRHLGAIGFAGACVALAMLPTVRRFAVFPEERVAKEPWIARALHPIARAAAAIAWTRGDRALRHGETSEAYALADSALAIDPRSPHGWIFLARHFVLERASRDREPDARDRALWVKAGLDVLDRGERASREPGAIAFERGIVYAYFASTGEPSFVGATTAREAWERAAEAFDRARALGAKGAAEARDASLERASSAD